MTKTAVAAPGHDGERRRLLLVIRNLLERARSLR